MPWTSSLTPSSCRTTTWRTPLSAATIRADRLRLLVGRAGLVACWVSAPRVSSTREWPTRERPARVPRPVVTHYSKEPRPFTRAAGPSCPAATGQLTTRTAQPHHHTLLHGGFHELALAICHNQAMIAVASASSSSSDATGHDEALVLWKRRLLHLLASSSDNTFSSPHVRS
jgi:hypothetical protein